MLTEALSNVAILGAAGKMGCGISLLFLRELAKRDAEATGTIGSGKFKLELIDLNSPGLPGLREYLETQLAKYADKNQSKLKETLTCDSLPQSPDAFPAWYAEKCLALTTIGSDLKAAKNAKLVCEAIIEEVDIKVTVLRDLKKICGKDTLFLTNTSSIPISALDELAELDHRIVGFHFYNPPPVQKLLEIITSSDTKKDAVKLAEELAHALGKTIVHSNDVAGFIGNGHFMRDILYACSQTEKLINGHSHVEAVYLLNKITQDYMLRPMGVFQLIDYVGIDVCQKILKVMSNYIPEKTFHAPLLDDMLKHGVKGGQNPDGSQKDGFLKYQLGLPVAVFDPRKKVYLPLDEGKWRSECDEELGELPSGHRSWKYLLKAEDRQDILKSYFSNLFKTQSLGSRLAQQYLLKSRSIAEELVEDGVASNVEDVNTVLEQGFYHLYGPANNYF